jgi:hypothetical protein
VHVVVNVHQFPSTTTVIGVNTGKFLPLQQPIRLQQQQQQESVKTAIVHVDHALVDLTPSVNHVDILSYWKVGPSQPNVYVQTAIMKYSIPTLLLTNNIVVVTSVISLVLLALVQVTILVRLAILNLLLMEPNVSVPLINTGAS